MNYDQRIAALKSFKSAVSAGSTTDNVSGVSEAVEGWEGDSKTKFDDYIKDVKSDSKNIAGKKRKFLAAVDRHIASVKSQLEAEVSLYRYVVTQTYDRKSASKNRSLKRRAVNNLMVDESVKKRLLRMI